MFTRPRDAAIALVLLFAAIALPAALRPAVAAWNDRHLLHDLLASRRTLTFLLRGPEGPVLIETASSNGQIVNATWTAIIYRGCGRVWIRREPFDHPRTEFLCDPDGRSR
jgi:hypothetical protein